MYEVSVVVRGVSVDDEDYLGALQDQLEALGAIGAAVVYYPEDREIGMVFEIKEDTLGRLLQPEGDRAAA